MLSQDDIDDLFAAFGPVRTRSMFGGAGLYADGLMFAVEVDETIFLKADPQLAAELEARGARRFTYEARGRTVNLNFWSLPDDALDAPEDLARLAGVALSFARREADRKAAAPRAGRRKRAAP